ncbi:MAG: CPBP family intramembrane metalloprotease [Silvibacterium sp.]|nr:CPBP family intramembrane metalloprotease [Silvibacterium sp.]
MKISDNPAEELPVPAQQGAPRWPVPSQPVAPWWHTAVLIAVTIGVSVLSSVHATAFGAHHLGHYTITLAWEWALAVFAWWGIKLQRVQLRQLLGEWRSGAGAWLADFATALIFWLMAAILLAALSVLLYFLHLRRLEKAVLDLAPKNAAEFALWVALCITAGIVEEFLFRGYFLQQFASIKRRLWIGVFASSLLFGAAHGYEGVGAMIAITAYGGMFCALATQQRSLRAGMMAHAWHDLITGAALALAKYLHTF